MMLALFNYAQSSATRANTFIAMTLLFVREQQNMESKRSKITLESTVEKVNSGCPGRKSKNWDRVSSDFLG